MSLAQEIKIIFKKQNYQKITIDDQAIDRLSEFVPLLIKQIHQYIDLPLDQVIPKLLPEIPFYQMVSLLSLMETLTDDQLTMQPPMIQNYVFDVSQNQLNRITRLTELIIIHLLNYCMIQADVYKTSITSDIVKKNLFPQIFLQPSDPSFKDVMDPYQIDPLCQNYAKHGDLRPLRTMIQTNQQIRGTCQKY